MSLISYVLTNGFTVIASDVRKGKVINNSTQPHCKAIVWFEPYHKVFIFPAPHNYFAVACHGVIPSNTTELFREFEATLPAERLTIEEYSLLLGDFFTQNLLQQSYEHRGNDKHWFNVVGYSPNSFERSFIRFNLPDQPQPEEIMKGARTFIETGFTEFAASYKEVFRNTFMENFTKKLDNKKKLGFPYSKTENQMLDDYLANKSSIRIMSQADCINFSQGLIEETSAKLFESDELESVGKATDTFVISPNKGLEIVSYDNSEEILSESARHIILIDCCQPVTKIQINFVETDLLKKGFIKYPENNKFACSNCKTEYDLSVLRFQIEESANKQIVI
ncbi:MAG TPA: hypothetical protein VNI84_18930 [Pyrinomonadaceae bacterium]|nr:hypothetical protein [Pyrinomonadaceae bacterium]